jgi:iron complex outermembrane receptor protein
VRTVWRFQNRDNFAIGGENIFDAHPDVEQDPSLNLLGVQYALTSPFGFNGGFWYARIGVDF